MARILRYQISDWSQATECLSNNSRNYYISLNKCIDGANLNGLVLQVNHSNYGVLFAAMIRGEGSLICQEDEEGNELEFMTTSAILRELERFGFYIKYDVKSNLPMQMISFLATVDNLGFDKITKIYVESRNKDGALMHVPTIIAMKSNEHNDDILTFGCKISKAKFSEKLAANTVMNVTHQPDTQWDWLTYMVNISDILDENVDPTDDFETETGIDSEPFTVYEPSGAVVQLTPYYSEDVLS